jgi:hypothetical protein
MRIARHLDAQRVDRGVRATEQRPQLRSAESAGHRFESCCTHHPYNCNLKGYLAQLGRFHEISSTRAPATAAARRLVTGHPFFDPASARKPLFSAGVGRCAETLKLHHERQREDRDRDR